jgi:hypothetical protein
MQLTAAVCRDDDQDHNAIGGLSVRELKRVRRRMATNLGLTPPYSPARRPIESHLNALEAELDKRRQFQEIYLAHPSQVRIARHAAERFLSGCPRADDASVITSELATNAVLHSASHDGGYFTLRAELYCGFIWIEVEDSGGPWHGRHADPDEHPHGLAIISLLSGANWGADDLPAGRVVWARLEMR